MYGLAVRAAIPWMEQYALLVSNEGYWQFFRVSDGTWRFMTPEQQNYSTAIKTGTAWNHLKIVADGPDVDCFINGVHVLELDGAVLASGQIGLVSLAEDSGVQVGFERLRRFSTVR